MFAVIRAAAWPVARPQFGGHRCVALWVAVCPRHRDGGNDSDLSRRFAWGGDDDNVVVEVTDCEVVPWV